MKKLFIPLILFFSFSCNNFYQVHEYQKNISILIHNSKISTPLLMDFIDTLNVEPRCKSMLGEDTLRKNANNRVVFFCSVPTESYLISFDAEPFWIESIYNVKKRMWLKRQEDFSKTELERIEKRFHEEIIDSAVRYYKNLGIEPLEN